MNKLIFAISPKSGKPYARLSTSISGVPVSTFDRASIAMVCASLGINYEDALAVAPHTIYFDITERRK